jgi:perosamine synthetase
MVNEVIERLKSVVTTPAPLHEPTFDGKEEQYTRDCIVTGWVSSVGAYVDRFEKDLASFCGVRKAVALSNGTSALDLALRALGVQAGDEILVPAVSFAATANAVTYSGAIPHFVDVGTELPNLDPQVLREYLESVAAKKNGETWNRKTNRRIFGIIPVHVFGHPVDMEGILPICQEFNLRLIEDAAEALGSYYQGKHVGHWGELSMLSFNGNKIVTTGGGGALLTQNEELGKRIKHLSTTAKVPHPWRFDHDAVGFNYRLPNLNAALGCAQLERLNSFIEEKRKLAQLYFKLFEGLPGLSVLREPKNTASNYWLNAIAFDRPDGKLRDEVLGHLHERSILVRPLWTTLPTLRHFKDCPQSDLTNSLSWEQRIVCLPSGVKVWRAYEAKKA